MEQRTLALEECHAGTAAGQEGSTALNSENQHHDQPAETNEDAIGADVNPHQASEEQPIASEAPAGKARTANAAPPSGDQLAATRAAHWHQDGHALLNIEALREWLQRSGLVLYAPRSQQLGAPSPSWIEATLGKADVAPEIATAEAARNLLARLIAEGAAVPLNLLGATGGAGTDVPDFVASAAVFSYIFTLRGNKAWKQPPVTSGPVKVSPLALATFEILAAKVMLSSYDLATQLGKEVTEGAVLRALTELWSQLRVIPVPQADGSATLWELTSSRFTKQIKAGANAGQPSALSALISLYLGQAVAAEEAEIESFLSPLAPRSRVRDVIHALLAARQLETLVVKGKTLLHIAGDLPVFAAGKAEAAPEAEAEGGSRISKFAARPGSKIGTGLRAKPTFAKKPFGSRPPFGKTAGGDRERRPFVREDRPARARFDKPWQESPRPRFEAPAEISNSETNAPSESRPPRREFKPRDESSPRKTFSKPGTFGRKREFGSNRRETSDGASRPFTPKPFGDRDNRGARDPRSDRGERPAAGGFKRPGSYSPRPAGERPGFGGKPSFGAKPSFGPKRDFGGKAPFAAKPFGAKPVGRDRAESGGEAPRKTFRKFDAPRSPKPFGKPAGGKFFGGKSADRPERPSRSFEAGAERPRRSFDSPHPSSSDRPRASFDRPRSGDSPRPGFGRKPGGYAGKSEGKSFGAKKPFGGKPGGFSKPSGPFAKFADGRKPFRKPGPGKKPERPAASDGGYRPTKRRRPEEGEQA